MKNLIQISVIAFVFTIFFSSCGKNYNYQKVVVNNSQNDIVVQYDCCGDEKIFVIPAMSEQVVFICTYQSYQKPDCSDVEGKFTMSLAQDFDENAITKEITEATHWNFEEDGSDLSCIFTIEPNDIKKR